MKHQTTADSKQGLNKQPSIGTLRRDHGLGQSGVFRVSSEILRRGTPSWIPSVDFGADLMAADGIMIQVKSARLRSQQGLQFYWFGLGKNRHRRMEDRPDFYIMWGTDEDRFWVIPASRLAGKRSCAIPSRRSNLRTRRYAEFEGDWNAVCQKNGYRQPVLDGQSGTHRVLAELMIRGINASVPVVDTGVDLVAGDSTRVQVKAARQGLHQRDWAQMVHRFNLNTHLARSEAREVRNINYSSSIDVFVLWGIGDAKAGTKDRFWIVPALELDSRDRVFFGPDARWISPDKIKELRGEGHTYKEIGQKLGVATMTAHRKINLRETGKFEGTAKLRGYEDRWDLLTSQAPEVQEVQFPPRPDSSVKGIFAGLGLKGGKLVKS